MPSDWATISLKKDLKKEIETLLEKKKQSHPFHPDLPENPTEFIDKAAKEKLLKLLRVLQDN